MSNKLIQRDRVKSLPKRGVMREIPFSVDSALIGELGERLVGKPHIALAELVKNSYDADANKVIIHFYPDRIEIIDNGHGMDFTEFRDFWMRIGTPHKQEKRVSRNLHRPMTGSKGVGRLAVQFLASEIEMRTVSENDKETEIRAHVDWEKAVRAGDLIDAKALYEEIPAITKFPNGTFHGANIILRKLKQDWTTETIKNMAREIWWLMPPFRSNPNLNTDAQQAFDIELISPEPNAVKEFEDQMNAISNIWYARLVGKLIDTPYKKGVICPVRLSLEFAGEPPELLEYTVPACKLHEVEFEIRIFHLEFRQPFGIKVGEAREYLNEFGGVRVYDSGFHLPYYGNPKNDWLLIEFDHSHRLSRSKLLPDELQVPSGMEYLPTLSRLLGVVHVNTPQENEATRQTPGSQDEHLEISITRDRLVDNSAFDNLRDIVRYALDYYSMREYMRGWDRFQASRPIEPIREKFVRVEQVLERHREDIPQRVYETLRTQVQDAIRTSETEAELKAQQVGLLGALATAGISALAYEHEVNKQFRLLEEVIKQLEAIKITDQNAQNFLSDLRESLTEWLDRARGTRALFSPLLEEESRTTKARFKAKILVEDVKEQMRIFLRGIPVDTSGLDDTLRLPEARFTDWSSIFQNVFLNAVNAMIDSEDKRIFVNSRIRDRKREILVQDTGCGVNLDNTNELFKPFVRKITVSAERRALGYGGSGLGLTIVRMIAENIGCGVTFVKADKGYSTAFQVSWSEEEWPKRKS
jgi:signal transduction histidine kinase